MSDIWWQILIVPVLISLNEHSYEKQFLKDFIDVASDSAGARLASWLQPESRLDPKKCVLRGCGEEPLRNGWPTQLIVETRDQYGAPVYVPDIKIEIRAVYGSEISTKDPRKDISYGDLYSSDIYVPKKKYRTTVKEKEKSYLKAISAMKSYSDYSFEELRVFSFLEKKNSEIIRAEQRNCTEAFWTCSWTPSATGNYCLSLIIDDTIAEQIYKVEVIDCGAPPPLQKATLKKVQPQSRLRKFIAKNSAGLRIRLHPTLQSEQVGILNMNGIISFVDELENDDGVWLRLSNESIREHCSASWFPAEAWCLQYNQHLDKTLLFPVIDSNAIAAFDMDPPNSEFPDTPKPTSGGTDAGNEDEAGGGKKDAQEEFDFFGEGVGGGEKENVESERCTSGTEVFENPLRPLTRSGLKNSSSASSSQSNLGATIAGVVGEGAIKLQALQKWFKGEKFEGNDGRQEFRRSESDAALDNEEGISQLRGHERSQSLFGDITRGGAFDPRSSPFKTAKRRTNEQAEDFAKAFLRVTADIQEQRQYGSKQILKRALSPSIAETLRTVFAAFLWHEGLIHDAMACASFLKFHPTISKDFSVLENFGEADVMTHEQKVQQRHSLEIASAEAYLNMRPATIEALTKSGNYCVHNRKRRSIKGNLDDTATGNLGGKFNRETLPPALKGLVYMWDQLCCNFIQLAETNATDKDKLNKPATKAPATEEKRGEPVKTYKRVKKEDGSWCELCDIFLPIPVTYHMRIVHPGCGKTANGKGYNSIGVYCEGWAGNCGEGGQGASSWYLMCDKCREKYSLCGKKTLDFNHMSGTSIQLSYTLIRSELFSIMKENSLFLLELNASNKGFASQMKDGAAGGEMFTIKERSYTQYEGMNDVDYYEYMSNTSYDDLPIRAAKNATATTFESIWCPPDQLACLDILGARFSSNLPYNLFGTDFGMDYERNFFNDASSESFEPPNRTLGQPPSVSKFHRSFSVEQGWLTQATTMQNIVRRNTDNSDEDLGGEVIMRRKKNCTCEGKSSCDSVLLRYPSNNLKRLVPANILATPNGAARRRAIETDPPPQAAAAAAAAETEEENLSASSLLHRPSMLFILEQHDLKKLKCLMKKKIQKTIGSIYSLQALNWIMRSVTQTVSLHDLMWWFVAALKPSGMEESHIRFNEEGLALDHPVLDNQIGGKICEVHSQSLHNLLQTIAELTLLLPSGSALQKIAIQCFGLKFRPADHQFLHRSHVFGNISKILSKSEEQNEENSMMSLNFGAGGEENNTTVTLNALQDITDIFEITVSSRPAMLNSLIDNSTETFWESDEEDRNKPKLIEASQIRSNCVCKMVSIHIDNSRDVANKVTNVFFYGGQSLREMNFILSIDVEPNDCAWHSARIEDDYTHFRMEFRGAENSLRVRQIKLLGLDFKNNRRVVPFNSKSTNAVYIQQQNCEIETLRVFRLLTNQVFGKLIVNFDYSNAANGNALATPRVSLSPSAESLDLREHMVGILFSRSKLTHLQKQIIVHIVQAIKKETQKSREEWENSIVTTSSFSPIERGGGIENGGNGRNGTDTYIFELLSMVLALSGSGVGRSYLSHQHGLLRDLLSLLHTGSDRIQRQVTGLFRRILPEITPEAFGLVLNVAKIPQNDFFNHGSESFDMLRMSVLDIFLAVIAKSLQIQFKAKKMSGKIPAVRLANYRIYDGSECRSKYSAESRSKESESEPRMLTTTFHSDLCQSSISCPESLQGAAAAAAAEEGSRELLATIDEVDNAFSGRWFLKGTISNKQAENIIQFLKDIINGKFGERWCQVAKAAIAECIINLTRLDECQRLPENCIRTPTLWLALASLCVLDKEHVKRLSSSQWSKTMETRPMCTNHDDGITPAIIECTSCGSLCGDCDRFLHLPRRTRSHYRTLCKEEEEAISVELHENCGRTKLFWLMALADSKTLKGMIEFRDGHNTIGSSSGIGRCRFCGATGSTGLLAVGNVCADAQCQEYAANACPKMLSCGHFCGGIANETHCLPCLNQKCQQEVDDSAVAPKLTQDGDDMCMICFTEAISSAPSIQLECGHVFHYHCCRAVLLKRWYGPRITFGFSQCPICKTDIAHDSLEAILEPIIALKNDVKRKALMRLAYEGVKEANSKDTAQYAMDKYAYYVCCQCSKAYYGGEARCDAEIGENYNPKELVCGGCSDVSRAQMCPKHGTDYLEYKCRYCCSVAVFFCFGTTHFCDTCHDDFQKLTNIPKNKLPKCPVGPKAKQLPGEECPLHIVHPPTGEEFALGCGICRNSQTF